MGSIYRHNEGGAPLAVAECALKEALKWFSDCCASDDPSSRASKGLAVWPEGWAVGFRGWTWCRLVPVDGGFTMVCSLTILYRRKRNVGGRVLRNIGRCSTDTLADTFREKMLHASEQSDVRCIYVLVDSKD